MSTFGEELRRERELRRISLREVSEATKINLRFLDALENNHFEHLPGGVFNKGYVRAYAEFIGVDPEAMVNAYLLEERSQVHGAAGRTDVLRGSPGEVPDKLDAGGEATEPAGDAGARAAAAVPATVPGRAGAAWWPWALGGLAMVTLVVLGGWLLRGGRGEDGSASQTHLPPPAAPRSAPAETAAPPVGEAGGTPGSEPDGTAVGSPDRRGGEPSDGPATERSQPAPRPTQPGERPPETAEQRPERSAPEPAREPSATADTRAARPTTTEAPAARTPRAPRATGETNVAGRRVVATVVVARATSGRLNCDNRRVEVLDGLPAGTELRVECRRFLVVDAVDGGGLRLGLSGAEPRPLVADGVPLRGYRILPTGDRPSNAEGTGS